MVGDEEHGGFARQDIGDHQRLAAAIVVAGNAARQRSQAHIEPEDVEQITLEAVVEIVGHGVDLAANAFGGGLERGEVVGVGLQEIRDGVRGEVERGGFGILGQHRRATGEAAVSVIKLEHSPGGSGIGLRQVADFQIGQIAVGKQIVAKGFHQIPGQPALVTIDQLARFHPEISGNGKQQRHRDLAAIVLDQIEIAGGNAQCRGEVGLRQMAEPAQAADTSSNLGILWLFHLRPSLQDLQIYRRD